MVAITLPDGSVRRYDKPVTGAEVAADIGPGLAKAALAVKINGDEISFYRQGQRTHTVWNGDFKNEDLLLRLQCQRLLPEARSRALVWRGRATSPSNERLRDLIVQRLDKIG